MPLRAPKSPQSQADWDRWARNVPVKPDPNSTGSDQIKDGAVTEPKFADGAVSTRATADKAITPAKLSDANALTVFGNPLATNGTRADIALDANGKFLVRRANQLVGDSLQVADMPAGMATDIEVAAAVSAHESASNPHPQYAQLAVTNTFEVNQLVKGTVNDVLEIFVDNDSNGTDNAARIGLDSGDSGVALYSCGSGRTSSMVSGGPAGAQGCLRTLGNYPLVFGTNDTYRGKIDGSGFWFLDGLINAANDAAAAASGVPVGALYRNGSVLMVRVS